MSILTCLFYTATQNLVPFFHQNFILWQSWYEARLLFHPAYNSYNTSNKSKFVLGKQNVHPESVNYLWDTLK
jgi:hypothetical protein